jgi:hypothetical protein
VFILFILLSWFSAVIRSRHHHHLQKHTQRNQRAATAMACSPSLSLVNHSGGPGSAATSIAETIVKPGGERTRCIECGDTECCCIPIPCTIL